MMVCGMCKIYRTGSKADLETHLEKHLNGNFNCDRCDFVSLDRKTVLEHKREHTKNISCKDCPEKFSLQVQLDEHLFSAHKKYAYSCKFCDAEFQIKTILNKHLRSSHLQLLPKCENCNKCFVKIKHQHQYYCKKEKVPCEICGKMFSSMGVMRMHKKEVHANIRCCPCPFCSYAAKNKAKLKMHIAARHERKHDFQCDQCSFSCVQKIQLTSHMRTHTGDKPYKCDQCSYAAAWNVQLKEHKGFHGMACAVMCEKCNILFKSDKSYKMHEKKEHSGDTQAP